MYHVEDPTNEHSESGLAVHRAYIEEDVARACLDAMLIFLLLFGLDRTCLQSELDCGDGRFTLPAKFVLILHANAVEGRQSQVELFEPLGVLGRLLTLLNEQGKIVHPILDDRHAMACANLCEVGIIGLLPRQSPQDAIAVRNRAHLRMQGSDLSLAIGSVRF